MEKSNERADKFLWAVRLYKTRNKAAEACKKKQIIIGEIPAKASKLLQTGDEIKIKHPPVFKIYKIKQILHNRVGAKLVQDYIEEITPQEYLDTLDVINKNIALQRDRGTGRPTKKDRRDLKNFFE
ncbi:MAG: RNA-binding S4 domain-containing protein [Bacteroidales bacterium]|nr:RNA-binding S4 domain-containing protein [Bacteroidales bacterium]